MGFTLELLFQKEFRGTFKSKDTLLSVLTPMQPYPKEAGGCKRLLAANSCHYFVKMLFMIAVSYVLIN